MIQDDFIVAFEMDTPNITEFKLSNTNLTYPYLIPYLHENLLKTHCNPTQETL